MKRAPTATKTRAKLEVSPEAIPPAGADVPDADGDAEAVREALVETAAIFS